MRSRKSMLEQVDTETALDKHVKRFANEDKNFNPSTVSGGLEKIHGSGTTIKGALIAFFNANHANFSGCPVMGATFKKDAQTGFAKNLHLGTTRIWKADGSIDEKRWDDFIACMKAMDTGNPVRIQDEIRVFKSAIKDYLNYCYKNDPQESNTGRNTCALFSSKPMQGFAATAAWDEVYDRLTCGWQDDDPYITSPLIRLFFEDSDAAFKYAEDNRLPVSKGETVALGLMKKEV